MREIRFRAWDKQTRNWCELFEVDNIVQWYNRKHGIYRSFFDNHIELMQYTGLKDMDRKEIYEGDIVEYGYNMIGKVYYDEAETSYVLAPLDTRSSYEVLGLEGGLKVIGNIYENPEFLKEEENNAK